MRHFRLLYLALGAALFAVVLASFDLADALRLAREIGLLGFAGLLFVSALVFLLDSLLWLLCLPALPGTPRWYLRLVRVRAVGEAYNDTLPAAGLGGEPVKALLLKSHYGVALADSTISIVLFRTINLVGQLVFLVLAFALMLMVGEVSQEVRVVAAVGFAGLVVIAAGLMLFPAWHLASRTGRRLDGRPWARRVVEGLDKVEEFERRIAEFYRRHPVRFAQTLVVSLAQWLIGAGEIWLALWLLGYPVGIAEAVVIEALVQGVRSASFFIPSNLGTQDGAIVLISGMFTGVPVAGLSTAILRRLRQIVWVALGFAVGGHYSWRTFRSSRRPASEQN